MFAAETTPVQEQNWRQSCSGCSIMSGAGGPMCQQAVFNTVRCNSEEALYISLQHGESQKHLIRWWILFDQFSRGNNCLPILSAVRVCRAESQHALLWLFTALLNLNKVDTLTFSHSSYKSNKYSRQNNLLCIVFIYTGGIETNTHDGVLGGAMRNIFRLCYAAGCSDNQAWVTAAALQTGPPHSRLNTTEKLTQIARNGK